MLEDKWNEKYCYEVFRKGGWTICLRPRCNVHEGEPDMKVWILLHGEEVAQYTNNYRGYGQFEGKEDLLPNAVRKCGKKAWKKLCEGRYTEENLEKVRERYFSRCAAAREEQLAFNGAPA